MLIDLGDTHSHIEGNPNACRTRTHAITGRQKRRLPGHAQQQCMGGFIVFCGRGKCHERSATCVLASPDISQHQRHSHLCTFRNRVTEQVSRDSLPLIKCTDDGCDAARLLNASNRISVNLRGVTQGHQTQFYEGRNPAGFPVPPETELMNFPKKCIFLHLKALSAPGQGYEKVKRRFHFGAEL